MAGVISEDNAALHWDLTNDRLGIGLSSPTAALHLKAGTSAANSAPLKLTSGTNLNQPEAGAIEFDGTNYFATSGTTRYTLAKTLTATANLDFPATPDKSFSTLTISVAGATDGDAVVLGVPNSVVQGASSYMAFATGGTVTIKFINSSGASIDPASGTFRVSVLKY